MNFTATRRISSRMLEIITEHLSFMNLSNVVLNYLA